MQTAPNWLHGQPSTPSPGPGSQPRNVIVRPLSSSTMVIQWDEPEEQNGVVTGYKVGGSSVVVLLLLQVYYTTTPNKPLNQWESQFVDNNKLTTISDLTPHTIYTIRYNKPFKYFPFWGTQNSGTTVIDLRVCFLNSLQIRPETGSHQNYLL